jgi:hypothetical protein
MTWVGAGRDWRRPMFRSLLRGSTPRRHEDGVDGIFVGKDAAVTDQSPNPLLAVPSRRRFDDRPPAARRATGERGGIVPPGG